MHGTVIPGSSSSVSNQDPLQTFPDQHACFEVVWTSRDRLCQSSPFFKKGKPVCQTQILFREMIFLNSLQAL